MKTVYILNFITEDGSYDVGVFGSFIEAYSNIIPCLLKQTVLGGFDKVSIEAVKETLDLMFFNVTVDGYKFQFCIRNAHLGELYE